MANPFLVLGGIAVSIITATFGILQVPGWVNSAKDASVYNDIDQVTIGEAAALSTGGKALEFADLTGAEGAKSGVVINVAAETVHIEVADNDTDYVVAIASESGNLFGRVNGGEIVKVELSEHAGVVADALADLNTELGVVAEGFEEITLADLGITP